MGTEESPKTLDDLQELVRREIDAYSYEVPAGSIGNGWTEEEVSLRLQQMRLAIVSPYWKDVEIRDTLEEINQETPAVRTCAVVAQDGSDITRVGCTDAELLSCSA